MIRGKPTEGSQVAFLLIYFGAILGVLAVIKALL